MERTIKSLRWEEDWAPEKEPGCPVWLEQNDGAREVVLREAAGGWVMEDLVSHGKTFGFCFTWRVLGRQGLTCIFERMPVAAGWKIMPEGGGQRRETRLESTVGI